MSLKISLEIIVIRCHILASHLSQSVWNLFKIYVLLTGEQEKEKEAGGDGEAPKNYPYPKSVFFIISTEFCERFSYYGMKSK